MDLTEWLYRQRMTTAEFARQLNMDRTYINCIKTGYKPCSIKLALKIEEVTEGQVTAKELLYDRFSPLGFS